MRKLTTTLKALMLVAAFIWSATGAMAQTLIISEVVDGTGAGGYPKYVEITNVGSASAELLGLKIMKSSNGGPFAAAHTFEAFSLPAGESMVVANLDNSTAGQLWTEFNLTAPTNVVHGATGVNGNGDDAYALADASDAIIDIYGAEADGTGLDWEYLDSYSYRNASVVTPNTTFAAAEWTLPGINVLDGQAADLSSFLTPGTHTFDSGTPDPEPTNHVTTFVAAEDDASSITLTWADNDGAQAADAFLVKASTGAIAAPVDATEEADDTDLSDGAGVINVAHGTETYTFTGLTANTTYNFEVYPYTNAGADIDFKTDGVVPSTNATTMAGGTLTWYNLQWPGSGEITVGGEFIVYAQTYEDGVTNAAGAGAGITAWIGYSMEDTDPSTWTNWIEAPYDSDQGNNDQFSTDLGAVLPMGQYYYASRFQFNGGDYMYGGYVENAGGPWDGTTNVSGVLTVKSAPITTPFSETFDADLGNMYTYSVLGDTKAWYQNSGAANINGYDSGETEEDWMIFPAIDLSAKVDEFVAFDSWYNYGTEDANNYFKLMYSEDYAGIGDPSSATWTELTFTAPSASSTWAASGDVDLSTISGTEVYIAFKYHYEAGSYRSWSIDNIVIEEAPLLEAPVVTDIVTTPANPTSSDAISVSADVTDADGTVSTVTLNWGTETGVLGTAINMSSSKGVYVTDTDIPAQADGTTVYYEIVAVDNDAQETTTEEMTIVVADPAQVAFPYTNDFESGDISTDGWITRLVVGTNDWYLANYSGSNYYAEMKNYYGGNTAAEAWLISPAIDLSSATAPVFSFDNTCNYSGDDIAVYVSTDYDGIGDPTTATWDTLNPDLSAGSFNTVNSGKIDLTDYVGGNLHVAFKYVGTDSDGKTWQVDNITLMEAVLEPVIANIIATPDAPTSSDIVTVSADVTTEVGTLTSVELNWGLVSGTLDNTVTMTAVDDTYSGEIPAQADETTVYYEIAAVNEIPNTTTSSELSYTVTDIDVATQLSITAVNPASPYVDQVFSVEVTALDVNDLVGVVSEDTEVQIDLSTGTGTIGGVVTGTILNGTSTVTISDLTYDVVETININASTVTGMTLTTSADYEVVVADLPDVPLVFISEYIEGSSSNKAVEIYNGTGAELDLTGFSLKKSSNGDGVWDNEAVLSGTVAVDDVFVAANDAADAAILNIADAAYAYPSPIHYNGNDAVGLFFNGDLIDVIGVPSEDTIWSVAGVVEAAAEHTLVRKYPDVTIGNTDWLASAGTDVDDSEWIVYDQNDFSYIGWHGVPPTVPTITNVVMTPLSVTSTDAVSVSADVTDPNGTVATVTLNWGIVSGTLDNAINMTVSTGDTYVTDTDIPAQADGTVVYYEIVAVDNDAESTTTDEMMYTVSDPSVVSLPYLNGFDDDNLGDMYSYSAVGDQVWETSSYGNPQPGAYITGFVSPSSYFENEDWLITPGLDFSGVTNAYMTFDEAINYTGSVEENHKVYASTDYTGAGDPSVATWTELAVTGRSTADTWDWFTVTPFDLTSYAGEAEVYIAFVYTSNTTVAGTWELDNVSVQEGIPSLSPDIADITLNPAQPTSADEVLISATITDGDGTISSAVLEWGENAFALTSINMVVESGDTWVTETAIPAQAVDAQILYKIVATDNDANETETDFLTYSVYEPFAGVFPFYEPFYYDLGVMTTQSIAGSNEWYWDDYGYAKVSGHNNGVNEDWLITPMLDLSGDYDNVTLMFEEAINFAGTIDEQQEVYVSTDYVDDASTATWTKLTVTNRPVGDSWDFNDVDPISLNDYIGEASVYVGFKYTSTDTDAATWEVDNIEVTTGTGIAGANVNDLTIYPNPAQNEVFVTGVENISNVQIIGLDGKVVVSEQTNSNRIDVSSVNDGMYILRVISGNEVYTTRFVKE